MVRTGKTPSDLLNYLSETVRAHYFDRRVLGFPEAQRTAITERMEELRPGHLLDRQVEKIDLFDGFRYILEGGSWLLVRFSGTEPLLRIYAESDSPEGVQHLLDRAQEMAGL